MADSIADSIGDHPVAMAYLLGNWATDCRAFAIAGLRGHHRLISSMFDISRPTDYPATAVALRSVSMVVNRLVGMGLKTYINILRHCALH